MRWRCALVALAACSADAASREGATPVALTSEVGVTDVSILFPLPPKEQRLALLGTDDEGRGGPLLPRDLLRRLPPLDVLSSNDELRALLRVVAVRLDPCFPGLGDAPCQNQIRLVVQPIGLLEGGEGLAATDAALHLFYEVTRAEMASLLQHVVDLRVASGVPRSDGPVSVHPALAREGVRGPFGDGLRSLLLAHAGRAALTRVTFMGLEQLGQRWRFGGFDVVAAELRPLTIATANAPEQTFSNRDLDGVTFAASSMSPPSASPDDVRLLFEPASLAAAGDAERRAAYRRALRLENPRLHSPETVDCATCHVAGAARRFAERELGLSGDGNGARYAHPRGLPLDGATAERTDELRAFGYFDARPSISQRVVNETAEVVERVNREVRAAR